MIDLNRVERRAFLVAALLVVLAAWGRAFLTPGKEALTWRPAGQGEPGAAKLTTLRQGVEDALRREERAHTPLAAGERIDPNTAAEEELRRLPGIGPTRARAIVERRSIEQFRRRADLLSVTGIGAATLERIAPHLALPGEVAIAGRGGVAGAAGHASFYRPIGSTRTRPTCGLETARSPALVDLNRADSATLVSLPSIGPARAVQILRWRVIRSRFESLEDLLEIPGIGPRTLDRLKTRVCVG